MNRGAAILAAGAVALALTGAAVAGKPGGTSGGGKRSSTIQLVTMAADGGRVAGGQPAFGDEITYDVTAATPQPYVETACFQNGTLVYKQSRGFFADYYAGTQWFTLGPTNLWKGGAASCTARVIEWVNGMDRTLSSTSFEVAG